MKMNGKQLKIILKKLSNLNNKNAKPFEKNQTVLISTRFVKKNNKLSIKKFAKKGTYFLPAKIIKIVSSFEYWIQFSIDNEKLCIKKILIICVIIG